MGNKHLLAALGLFAAAFTPTARAGDADSPAQDEPKAISFPLSYTGEGFGNLSGGYKRGAVYDGLISAGVQGDLDKLIGWQGGSFLVDGLYPHGPSITQKYVHDFNGVSSIDAYDSVRLCEAWVQQELVGGKLSVRLGQMLADSEFFVSDNGALFLNGAFGAIPLISQNLSAPVFPLATQGMRVRWTFSDSLALQAAFFDGDTGNGTSENKHGVEWRLNGKDGVLALAELAYKVNGAEKDEGMRGVYKLGAFFHNPDEDAAFPDASSRSDGGVYVIADQQLWRISGTKDQGLSGFVRIGGAPDDRNAVPFYFDTGLNFKGLIPGRESDIAGLGFSYTRLSPDLRDDEDNPPNTHHEGILEATYKVTPKEWLTVQPDIQYIFNPGGIQHAPNALVIGLRFSLTFQ